MPDPRVERYLMRRRQIKRLHARGMRDDEIATRLGASRKTVERIRLELGLPAHGVKQNAWHSDARRSVVARETDAVRKLRKRLYGDQQYEDMRLKS